MYRLRTGLAVAEAPAVPLLLNPSIESSEHLGSVAVTATEVRSDYLTLTRARSQPRVAQRLQTTKQDGTVVIDRGRLQVREPAGERYGQG